MANVLKNSTDKLKSEKETQELLSRTKQFTTQARQAEVDELAARLFTLKAPNAPSGSKGGKVRIRNSKRLLS